MRTKLFSIFISTILIGCKSKQVDYRPFDKLDLEKKCAVYFIRCEGDYGDFEKTNKDFVLTDKIALQKLKDNWGLTKTDKRMACGFGYLVFITQNDKLVEQIDINEPCGYATTTGGWYDFDDKYYEFIDIGKINQLTRPQADSIQMTLVNQEKDNSR